MAAFDVMPVTSEHGGHSRVETFSSAATPTYRPGEWVLISATGTIQEQGEVLGGSTYNPQLNRIAADDGLNDIARLNDPRFVDPPNTGRMDSCYVLLADTEFKTRNVFDGDNTNVGPAGAFDATLVIVGDTCGMHVTTVPTGTAAIHGIDVSAAGLVITRLLDAQGRDSALTGAAVDEVHFRVDL